MKTRKNQTTAAISLICLAILVGFSGCHKGKNWALPEEGPPPVVPAGQFDLKGFFLGMSEGAARRVMPVFCADQTEVSCYGERLCWIDGMSVAGEKTKTTYLLFKDNQLTAFSVRFPAKDFVQIAAVLTSEYGKPSSQKTEKLKNGWGMPFEKLELGWKVKDASVSISNVYEKVNEGAIVVKAAKPSPKFIQCQLNAAKKAKEDL
jgi:hypothetical protein